MSSIVRPFVTVNRQSPVPLYAQVADQIQAAIQSGELGPGDRIENELTWAEHLGLSRPTVRQAIQSLVDRGLLIRRRGIGTQVVSGPIHRPLELTSLYEDLNAAGKEPTTTVLLTEIRAVDEETARSLRAEPGSSFWYLERLRSVNDEPLAIMRNYLPLTALNLTQVDLSQVGLYAALRTEGHTMQVAEQRIGARRATSAEARLLKISQSVPLVTMRRLTFDSGGRVLELGHTCYRSDMYSFDLTLVRR